MIKLKKKTMLDLFVWSVPADGFLSDIDVQNTWFKLKAIKKKNRIK